ncbi:EVE domain-containing protein [Candidatus Uhrbacteria bacterium]|nr:EVE domain-containing protein [Candidatus Uhrbacteria bacterium]
MAYWLLKTEPGTYSWGDLVADKKTTWDGVRNFQARNHLKAMKANDVAFIYHSGAERQIVGIARVVSGPYPEPKADDWTAVDLVPWKAMAKPVTLLAIKMRKTLAQIPLLKQARLSVVPITLGQAKALLTMGKTELEK